MHFHIITLFPEGFDSYLKESILGRAIESKKISVKFYNPMDYCEPKRRVDDRPYGGGPGMVLRPELFLKAFSKAVSVVSKNLPHPQPLSLKRRGATTTKFQGKLKIINFSPNGKKFDTAYAKTSAKKYTDIVMISGRYEGIDARVGKIIKKEVGAKNYEEISIGDYVLTSGDLPAMVLIDSISRQIHGVLGKYESLEEERVSSSEVYTRPEILEYPFIKKGNNKKTKNTNTKTKTYKVPKVLLSGNHKLIDEWKQKGK